MKKDRAEGEKEMKNSDKRRFLQQMRCSVLEDHKKVDRESEMIKERAVQWGRSYAAQEKEKRE